MTAKIFRIRRPLIVAPVAVTRIEPIARRDSDAMRLIMGLSASDFWDRFDAVRLQLDHPMVRGELPTDRLRTEAWHLICSHRWRTCSRVICLGREVGKAFGFGPHDPLMRWERWGYWHERRMAIIPHPSWRSGWWRNSDNLDAAARFLREAAGLDPEHPQQELPVSS